jgi:hypothetical protein
MKRAVLLLCLLLTLLLTACTGDRSRNQDWQVSPTFDVIVPKADGTQITYTMRGQKEHLGFIDSPFIAGKVNKYMWHLWGPPEQFSSITTRLKVIAVPQHGNEELVLVDSGLGGAHNGASAHAPSLLKLPRPGLWRLTALVDDKPFGEIVVEVAP